MLVSEVGSWQAVSFECLSRRASKQRASKLGGSVTTGNLTYRVRDGSPMEVWPTAACTGALLASNETKYLQGRGEMFLFSFLRARFVSRLDIGRGVDRLFILVGQPNE